MSRLTLDNLLSLIYGKLKVLESQNIDVYLQESIGEPNFPFVVIIHGSSFPRQLMQDSFLEEHFIQVNVYSKNSSVSEILSIGEQIDNLLYKFSSGDILINTRKILTRLLKEEDYWLLVLRYLVDVKSST